DVPYYESVNTNISKKITFDDGRSYQGSYLICKNISPEDTVERINSGYICVDGSETVIRAAIDKYKRLKKGITLGKTSVCELEAEIESGNAFSPEKIDESVDRVIDFAIECASGANSKATSFTAKDMMLRNIAYESTVLLKNKDNILPLKLGTPVVLAGDILVNYDGTNEDPSEKINELSLGLLGQGHNIAGFSRSYIMGKNRSAALLNDLNGKLQAVDTAIIFLGTNPQKEEDAKKSENLYLPANQLAAIDKAHSLGKKVIAVVSSDLAFDVSFDNKVDALLVAPLNIKQGVEAVLDVIMGKLPPSGRLSTTLYRDIDRIERKQGYYLGMPQSKVGTFLGYRYYDSADYDPAYPFGFGLGYSNIVYSNLSIQGNAAAFTVTNKGKTAAVEVAQVYIGMNSLKRVRPKKQLVGFEKITLQPGVSMTVTVPFYNLESFDEQRGGWFFEQGSYTVYVGSSVRDIKISQNVNMGNAIFESKNESASDYLQSETNIISERYTLEADYKLMKRDKRNIIFGTGALALAVAMFLFSLISGKVSIFFLIIATILAIGGVIMFVLEGKDRNEIHKSEREMINEANKEQFKDAKDISMFAASEIFVNEFDKVTKEKQAAEASSQMKVDNYLEFVNDALTFDAVIAQFIEFAASKGYRFEENTVRELFAAMSGSRLIITRGMTCDSFTAIIKLLSEYFDTKAGVDLVDASYANENNALYKVIGTVKQKTALADVLEYSNSAKEKICIAALAEVTFADMSNYFVPFARYIRNPRNAMVIDAVNESGKSVKFAPNENIWFFVNLRMGENLVDIPAYVAELAAVIKLEYAATVPSTLVVQPDQFNCYQLDFMLERIKSKYSISEETWKKIDSIESFVNHSAPYTIGNKAGIAMERFYAVFNACGGDGDNAIDRALSARVIPSAIIALDPVESVESKNLTEKLDTVFGEENVEVCRATVRASGSTVL
ncbi:MAG: glycoside hydrolase family 3 C-terminal domain-containing protein, partial [Clostridia bacterium]|nr:glycoside hydrolase family 3 C-terminal domain-containing protein [Clostridia bacterium]